MPAWPGRRGQTDAPARRSEPRRRAGLLTRRSEAAAASGQRRRFASFRARLALIALAGLVARVVYVLVLAADLSKGLSDRFYYHFSANLLARGEGFVEPFLYELLGRVEPSAAHPPMWTWALTLSSLLGADTWVSHQLFGCFVGAGVIVAVGLLGRRVAGPRIGLIAAGMAAAYPTLIAADGALMPESLYGLFVVLALLAAYRLLDKPDPRAAAAFGALIGLAALTRAEGLLFLLLPGAVLCLRGRRLRWEGARLLLIVLASAAIVIAPWTARNWVVFGEPVLISLNDSSVLAGANCPSVYSGEMIGGWDLRCLAERDVSLDEVEQARIWRQDGFDYAFDHADRWPAVVLHRVLRQWDLYKPRELADDAEGRDKDFQWVGTLIYFALVPLAIYGGVILRRNGGALIILVSPAVVATVSSVLGYGLPRFRQPAELTLVVLAAVTVAVGLHHERSRRRAQAPRSRQLA